MAGNVDLVTIPNGAGQIELVGVRVQGWAACRIDSLEYAAAVRQCHDARLSDSPCHMDHNPTAGRLMVACRRGTLSASFRPGPPFCSVG